ncbi:putative glycosyltransferase [Flavobacteriaceae bacterium 3519-10]|nr:putative glycosyltransferase [Flavobacteriaceae bacterium 3519-10]
MAANTQTMKFSVIIPVYNVEPYLEECLDSLLAQTYHDYEVLLINDGSTDASGKICDRYSEKDSRITVFHQPNKGVSAARNLGLEHAAGEWICFIDSDDVVESQYLAAFAENISADSDLVIQGIKRIGKVNDVFCLFTQLEKISRETFFDHYLIWPHYFSPCNKTYRRNIIAEHNLRFDESIHFAEDTIFNLDYAGYAKGMFTLLPNLHYIYRFNFDGLATRQIGFHKRAYLFEYVKDKLSRFTPKRDELYWYATPALKMLYVDRTVGNTYSPLKIFVKNHKREVLDIFDGGMFSMKCITFLIRHDCYFLLDIIFKLLYRNGK